MRRSLADDDQLNCMDFVNIMADLHDINMRCQRLSPKSPAGGLQAFANRFFAAMLGMTV